MSTEITRPRTDLAPADAAQRTGGRDLSDRDAEKLIAAEEHLRAVMHLARQFLDYSQLEELREIGTDIAIWAVQGHYRPETLDQVRELRPRLQRAGLGYLLDHWRAEQIRTQELSGNIRGLFSRQVEAWINLLWDQDELDPLRDPNVRSIEDLVQWLRRQAGTYRGLDDVLGGVDE